ncbi:MAG: hypothetical protein R2788_11115 [Saprospiraceae bacterium]
MISADLVEDSSDVPVDTIMVVDVMDVTIPVADNDRVAFADDDKEGFRWHCIMMRNTIKSHW